MKEFILSLKFSLSFNTTSVSFIKVKTGGQETNGDLNLFYAVFKALKRGWYGTAQFY